MKLDDVRAFFTARDLPFRWLAGADERPMKALRQAPLPLSVEVAIVLPDVHLGLGRGDPFQQNDPARTALLETFLDVVALLRDSLPGGRFAAVALGDFFDVMRARRPGAPFAARLADIRAAYPGVLERAAALPLLHCIGNHDHELFDHRQELPALGVNAHIWRFLGPGTIAFHGNDLVSLRDVELDVDHQTWLLSLVQSLAEVPLLGPFVQAMQRVGDDSIADPIFTNPAHTSLPWPDADADVPGWSAPWVLRDHAEQLGVPLNDLHNRLGVRFDLAIVGHTHRPGISFTEINAGRVIPLVDVGSWTYGRATFAVVCEEGIGIGVL
jgi:hypothetical protein